MIYDPFIDELAALPLNLIVRPADQQTEEGQTACWCPFCKAPSDSPHFIIYGQKRGGLYGRPVARWMCTKTHRSGYGAIELYAAIHGYGYWWRKDNSSPSTFICAGEDLRRTCLELMEKAGNTREEIQKKWPALCRRDYREVAVRPQETLTFEPKTDFTPHDLAALGCTTWLSRDGVEQYGFDSPNKESSWHFHPSMLQRDFHIYAVARVTLPAVSRQGEEKSEVLVSTPWNPIFVCLADDEKEDCGSVFFPANDNIRPMVFSTTDEHTPAKVSRWLAGDRTFTRAVELRTSDNTGVAAAIKEVDPSEDYTKEKQIWSEETTDSGKTKAEQITQEIKEKDIRAKAIVYCTSAQDAVSTYYHLKALRHTYPNQFGSRWFHVCFPYGDVSFSPVHYNKMHRFADSIYTLFPSTTKNILRARDISCRYRDILRAELPPAISDHAHLFFARLFCRPVCSVRDFFLAYDLLPREASQYDGDINRLFSSCITSALCSDPFERKEKRDKNGVVKEVFYTINPATLWEFMASAGFARDVRPDEPDKIGRFVHIDGPFADELDPASMVQATIEKLKEYARQVNDERCTPDEYEKMVQAVLRANKEINEKTIASLPAVKLNYTGGYGRHIDHFFYENGVLRITDTEISLHSYEDIDFNVERSELLHWNITPYKNLPFEISENPEYRKRLDAIRQKREQKDDLGKPLYTLQQLATQENELALWAQSHRWIVDWHGKAENEMWPPLRVIRGFANEEWEREQELLHDGRQFSSEEQMELDCRFANLIFCLGRMLWRYRDSKSNCISYLIENVVSAANRAEGGSGKSTFVRVFAGCAAHVLNVNGRDLITSKEFAANLAEYQHHKHRIVHWEDVDASLDFGKLYNLTTGDFSVRYMYKDRITVPLSEGPGHVVTSNYPLHDLDDSTMRRVCLGGFSHRFCGQNIMKNKAARYISDIMPDFNAVSPEKLSATSRNQIAMICALAVQFVMRYDEKVDAQKKYMEERTLTQSLGEAFLRFARVFFAQENIYGVPIDLDSMLEEYKADFAEASKNKNDSFSPKAFKRRILDYCETAGIVMNPPQLFKKADGKVLKKAEKTGYFAHQAWCTRRYFVGRDWEEDTTIQPKAIRELVRTEHAVYFYRTGKDAIPANNDELMAVYNKFLTLPDASPILDDQGNVVALTPVEQERWRNYLDSKQRKRPTLSATPAIPASVTSSGSTATNAPPDEELPF